MISERSLLWQYFSPEQQALARDGALLFEDRTLHPNEKLSDYSYLVFPFAKLYEGFLKQLFFDLHIIGEGEYFSDHFRIGKTLSPNMERRLGSNSAYGQVAKRFGKDLADMLWQTWKQARNLVFHYFPHNYRALSLERARELATEIVNAMVFAVSRSRVNNLSLAPAEQTRYREYIGKSYGSKNIHKTFIGSREA